MNIAVIGAGAWGTALAIALARQNRHGVSLWAFEKEVCDSIAKRGVNEMFLPGEQLPSGSTPPTHSKRRSKARKSLSA